MIVKNKKTGKKEDLRLPKVFKKKWLSALRSKKFKQGTHALQAEGKYCCLGVACRIMHPKLKISPELGLLNEFTMKIKVPEILKGNVLSWQPNYNPIVDKLVSMNDNGKSFKEIADFIEEEL